MFMLDWQRLTKFRGSESRNIEKTKNKEQTIVKFNSGSGLLLKSPLFQTPL